jgi:uncharacterized membrane protein
MSGSFPDIDLESERKNPLDFDEGGDTDSLPLKPRPARLGLVLLLGAALLGLWFAGTSTSDFVAHLDRDVHAIHCSLSLGDKAEMGESGCRTVMLSPYSSYFRDKLWGGIPVSLWALAVFAFLAYRSAHLLWRGKPLRSEAFFLFMATLLPVGMSAIYYHLAVTEVGAVCKVCVGIYISSALSFLAAIVTLLLALPKKDPKAVGKFALGFGEGVAFVGVLTLVYLGFVPEGRADHKGGAAGCGQLVQPDDTAGVMVPIAGAPGGTPSLEVLDPLCPACRAFDARLKSSGLAGRFDQKAVLFPLDATCNWMLSTSLHPGACAVSEAMLCAQTKDAALVHTILDWAFKNQEDLRAMAEKDDAALRARIESEFPAVKGCLGSALVKNRIVKSLRWAVSNALPVMTPQFFVKNNRVCDEDTDLGLEYTLTQMLAGGAK